MQIIVLLIGNQNCQYSKILFQTLRGVEIKKNRDPRQIFLVPKCESGEEPQFSSIFTVQTNSEPLSSHLWHVYIDNVQFHTSFAGTPKTTVHGMQLHVQTATQSILRIRNFVRLFFHMIKIRHCQNSAITAITTFSRKALLHTLLPILYASSQIHGQSKLIRYHSCLHKVLPVTYLQRESTTATYVVLVWVLLGCVSNIVTVQLLRDQYVHVK